MNEQELLIPCSWETRKALFVKRLLYVPDYYQDHKDFFSEELSLFVEQENPLIVEYCSGNGQWIIEQAQKNPHKNFIAVEKRFDRARKIWKKIHSYDLKNLVVVLGAGEEFSSYYMPKNSIDQIYVNFPDPWPKEKHAPKRILKKTFIDQIKVLLKKNGDFFLSSDHQGYVEAVKEIFLQDKEWKCPFKAPFHVHDMKDYGTSFFDTLFRHQDLKIYYLHFIKNV